jgi:hypothetical protein
VRKDYNRLYYSNVSDPVRTSKSDLVRRGFRYVVLTGGGLYVNGAECYSVDEEAVRWYERRLASGGEPVSGTPKPQHRTRLKVLPPTIHRIVRDMYVELRPGEEDLVAFMRQCRGEAP